MTQQRKKCLPILGHEVDGDGEELPEFQLFPLPATVILMLMCGLLLPTLTPRRGFFYLPSWDGSRLGIVIDRDRVRLSTGSRTQPTNLDGVFLRLDDALGIIVFDDVAVPVVLDRQRRLFPGGTDLRTSVARGVVNLLI